MTSLSETKQSITLDLLMKVCGVILALCAQAFAIYSAVDNRLDEMTSLQRESTYKIDSLKSSADEQKGLIPRVNDLERTTEENFKRIVELESQQRSRK